MNYTQKVDDLKKELIDAIKTLVPKPTDKWSKYVMAMVDVPVGVDYSDVKVSSICCYYDIDDLNKGITKITVYFDDDSELGIDEFHDLGVLGNALDQIQAGHFQAIE